jgi:RNA polymerase sigma-70 factor (ECF subfamily)
VSVVIDARSRVSDPGDVVAADLVDRLRRGDAAAVAVAYDRHHAAVRAFARRLLDDEMAAEDLVHDVFVALPSAIRGFRGESSLRTFLVSIAVHRARHHVRSAVRRRALLERLAREPIGDGADPERAAQGGELARALSRALDRLPLDQRVAFVLCEVEERTSEEAARIAGVPDATIRTRLFHARRKLRAFLEEEGIR